MSQRIILQLAKYGDVCEILRLCWLLNQKGERVSLMVAKKYADLLDGVSYVDPISFDGEPHELDRAYADALKLSSAVRCAQVIGPKEMVQKLAYRPSGSEGAKTDSFVKEAWRCAGHFDLWKEQPPLVFDKRDMVRETKLIDRHIGPVKRGRKRPVLLVSSGSESSPFPYANLLWYMLKLKFPNWKLVDLGKVKAERPYDLLGLYESATALVSVDTFHLHLATAMPTMRVVALTNDKPSLWFGSPWQANHIRYIRYSDFPARCTEVLDALEAPELVSAISGPRLIHVWSQYEVNPKNYKRHEAAKANWDLAYANGPWIPTPLELGAVGRDTFTMLKDDKRYPFVKDAIRLACMRATDEDIIVLTRCDTCLSHMMPAQLPKLTTPAYAHRMDASTDVWQYDPQVDLFAFTKGWWLKHQNELPDFVLGHDHHWNRVMLELIKHHGGVELPYAVWRREAA